MLSNSLAATEKSTTDTGGGKSMARNQSGPDGLARFLNQETFTLTVNAAIGRNKTYCNGIDSKEKRSFRKSLRDSLCCRVEEYRAERVGDDRHLANIETLSSTLSKHHREILLDGRFHIGAAQKALNLYLKFCWARGIVPEPPHCPIDSIVLTKITKCARSVACPICQDVTWTKIRCIHEYMHFVDKAKARAADKGLSLARWELKIWEKATENGGDKRSIRSGA